MIRLETFIALFVTFSSSANADTDQSKLARQIEEISQTATNFEESIGVGSIYPPLTNKMTSMSIDGCYVTVKYGFEQLAVEEMDVIEVSFDLARTQIPEPLVLVGDEFAFIALEGDRLGMAAFEISFNPPYKATVYSDGKELRVAFITFTMDGVPNEMQPRHLLALLNEYQAKYCVFTG